jgi:hypothetical protein
MQPAVDAAIEEMLFTSGELNRRLLGGDGAERRIGLSRCWIINHNH